MHFSIFLAALKTFHKSENSEDAQLPKSQTKSAALPHSGSSLTRTVHSPLLIPLQHMLVYTQSGILQQPVSQSAEPTTKAEPRPWVLTQPALAIWWIEEEQCRMWTQAYCRCRSYPNFPLGRQEHSRSKQTRSKTCAKNCHSEDLHITTRRGSTVSTLLYCIDKDWGHFLIRSSLCLLTVRMLRCPAFYIGRTFSLFDDYFLD